MIKSSKLFKVITNPALPVTKGMEFIGKLRKKANGSEPNNNPPAIQKIRYNSTSLIILRNPDVDNIRSLKRIFHIHPVHLDDIVSTIQRPKIDEESEYIFFVFHFPQFDPQANKLNSIEVDFFLTQNDCIAVIDPNFQAMEELIEKISKNNKEKEKYFAGGSGLLLYRLIDHLVDSIFPLLDMFEKSLERIDHDVFTSNPKNVTEQLSFLRRNVIFFQSLIKPELNSFTRIRESRHPFINRELKTYFSNITDHLKKIWDYLEDIIELSNNLSQTLEGYLNFRTNETIKILTMFSVILLPLTLLSGIYGMNLAYLPLAQHPNALFYIALSMFAVVFTMVLFFKYKKWI
ncbi:hypothetical protein A2W14_02675 [Candidatus Gottesmanbacteria bacterium RBG_16_37_8]|uniref:Magnesium transport protein CorA n=1 Tax=Candidatus Gottesmanbacteria bacterium RBG_16_37_8 TaxID=1798371 RepID=A0A1F5YRL2_9BACT|nr:MAG: hypothetical protein A2W14_02675 [Candidatus Gottesmanbacteria bacterium RBG_16_37_8]